MNILELYLIRSCVKTKVNYFQKIDFILIEVKNSIYLLFVSEFLLTLTGKH